MGFSELQSERRVLVCDMAARHVGVMQLGELLEGDRKGVIIRVLGPSLLPACFLKFVLLWQAF